MEIARWAVSRPKSKQEESLSLPSVEGATVYELEVMIDLFCANNMDSVFISDEVRRRLAKFLVGKIPT